MYNKKTLIIVKCTTLKFQDPKGMNDVIQKHSRHPQKYKLNNINRALHIWAKTALYFSVWAKR